MVSNLNVNMQDLTTKKVRFCGVCLSTDTKPTTGVVNGSYMIEIDTSTLYFFDEANSQWREWS